MAHPLDLSLRLALCGVLAANALAAQQSIGGCQILPASNVWNTPVLGLLVHAQSADYLATMGLGTGLHMDFGSGEWNGGRIGIPVDVVPNAQATVPIDYAILGWADESERHRVVKCHLCFGEPQCVKYCPLGVLRMERSEKGLLVGYPVIKED